MSRTLRPSIFSIGALVGLSACKKGGPEAPAPVPAPAPVAAPTGPWLVDGADDLSPGRSGPATVTGTLTVTGVTVGEGVTIRIDGGSDWAVMMDTPIRIQGDLALDGATWVLTNPGTPMPADGM